MGDKVIIAPYDVGWVDEYRELEKMIKEQMGELAVRIDHIGSTAVPGLAAKPVIDIQVSVKAFEPFAPIKNALEAAGFRYMEGNPERTKRYFREAEGNKRTHVHVRLEGHWSQQFPLLFRDYLRTHREDSLRYELLKYTLAERFPEDREGYMTGKESLIWDIMKRADRWAQETGWTSEAL